MVDSKRSGVKAILIPAYTSEIQPGQCVWHPETNRLGFACPGCAQYGSVVCNHPKPTQSPSWDIVSGHPSDPSTLTLAPSIHCISCCGWHGYLQNGVFNSC